MYIYTSITLKVRSIHASNIIYTALYIFIMMCDTTNPAQAQNICGRFSEILCTWIALDHLGLFIQDFGIFNPILNCVIQNIGLHWNSSD